MLGRTDSRRRLIVLMLTMAVIAAALGGRLAYWQIAQGGELQGMANAQLARPVQAEQHRGDITDRSGTLLATTAYRDRLVAYPDLVAEANREAVAGKLAALVGLSGADRDALFQAFADGKSYVTVARKLTDGQDAEVRRELASGDLVGVGLEPIAARFYPNPGGAPDTTLASQLLGFVTDDGLGRYGIEQRDQTLLAGSSADTASLDSSAAQPAPAAGASIQLTIDASLQLRVEKELYATWVADQAKRVSAVVMDPKTGAVLAWASVPGYDANNYASVARSDPDLFVDPIASQIYEPGSVMKMTTAAAALDRGVVDLNTTIVDDKELVFGHSRVRNADHKGMGPIPFEDAIAFSRNVATAKVAMELGANTTDSADVLYSMWQKLGFGRPTGIDLANEAAGITSNPDTTRWADIDLANRAFGQAVAVTPLQLAVAYSAMANGGRLVQPYLVASVDGKPTSHAEPQQVIDASLSQRLQQLMIHVLTTQPVLLAHTAIPGYTVGGKTGTAQFWDARTNAWATDAFNYTFCGFVGRQTPDLMIVVRINEAHPTVQKRNGPTLPEVQSFDLFRRIAQEAIGVLDLPPLPGFDPSAQPTDAPATDVPASPTLTPDAGASEAPASDAVPTESPDAAGYYPDWAEPSPTAEP